jgi:hypothetical protein
VPVPVPVQVMLARASALDGNGTIGASVNANVAAGQLQRHQAATLLAARCRPRRSASPFARQGAAATTRPL